MHRIGGHRQKIGYKLSILSCRNQIISLRLRGNLANDVKDVKYLFRVAKHRPSTILMDKGYDAEWIHEFFFDHNIMSVAPLRKNWRKGFFRKKIAKNFPEKLYHKRSRVESIFHSLKQKYGSVLRSKIIRTARSEIYCRAILNNLIGWLSFVLGQSQLNNNILKGVY